MWHACAVLEEHDAVLALCARVALLGGELRQLRIVMAHVVMAHVVMVYVVMAEYSYGL